ncbi:MAG: hypothetical protein OEY23_09895 [Acidimicrobiia bacterium]|nr:hypothetical protein [Acidimicrobiia bacterium]
MATLVVLALAAFAVAVTARPPAAGAAGGPGGAPLPAADWNALEGEPVQQWGVVGLGTTTNDPKPQVWDFAEIGDRIYVAGTFTGVQRNAFDPTSTVQPRAYLAAFNRDSGDWISSFTPSLDATVYALEVSPDGSLLVGGEFTTVNGQARKGLVALDPITGTIRPGFGTSVDRVGAGAGAMVRELVVHDSDLYVAGTFNQIVQGGNSLWVYQVVRLRVDTGLLDPTWLPRPTGSGVWDVAIDDARGRVHLAGYFTSVNALPSTANMTTVTLTTGSVVTNLTAFQTNDPNQTWTRSLGLAADRLYVGGAEHIVQVLDAGSRTRLGYSTTGVGCSNFSPTSCPNPIYIGGGDNQVIEVAENAVLAGCHCFKPKPAFTPAYDDRTHYSSFTGQFSNLRVAQAYDPATSVPYNWIPGLRENTWGTWAIFVDSRACVYIGGDYTRTDAGLWVGGFGRFCEPVTPPSGLSGSSANASASLSWAPVDSQLPVDRYRVSRGTTFLGETTGTTFTDANPPQGSTVQYRVETIDASRRRSAAATVNVTISGVDTQPPSTPPDLTATLAASDVTLSWGASTDNQGVKGYLVHRDFAFVAFVANGLTFTDTNVAVGNHTYQVRAQDFANNLSAPASVVSGPADTVAPTTPANLTATVAGADVALDWDASTDNVAVRGYLVHRDFQFVAFVTGATAYTDAGAPPGTHTYQVRAQDTSGNNSAPASVTAGQADTTPPSTPPDLVGNRVGADVVLIWGAATDNVGVTGYLVHRDFAFVAWVPAGLTYTDAGAPPGSHLYQVRAQDAVGNNSTPAAVTVP